MVEQGQMEEVEIQNNSIVFKSDQGEKGNLYKTGIIEDPKLVDRLHSAEVKYSYPGNIFIINFILCGPIFNSGDSPGKSSRKSNGFPVPGRSLILSFFYSILYFFLYE